MVASTCKTTQLVIKGVGGESLGVKDLETLETVAAYIERPGY